MAAMSPSGGLFFTSWLASRIDLISKEIYIEVSIVMQGGVMRVQNQDIISNKSHLQSNELQEKQPDKKENSLTERVTLAAAIPLGNFPEEASNDSAPIYFRSKRVQTYIECCGCIGLLTGAIGFVGGVTIGFPCMAGGAIVGVATGLALGSYTKTG